MCRSTCARSPTGRTKATLEIKAFDTTVLTGVKPTGVLIDELHEIAKVSAAERIIGQLRGGLLPNPEGFLVFITTAVGGAAARSVSGRADGGARNPGRPGTGRHAAGALRIPRGYRQRYG